MKREIKFRGLRTDGKGWVYGDLLHGDPTIIVVYGIDYDNNYTEFKVIPESVGQFTGLKDKNMKEIYEGDVLQTVDEDITKFSKFTIIWSSSRCRFMKHREDDCFFVLENNQTMIEVIGNIHENSELLN